MSIISKVVEFFKKGEKIDRDTLIENHICPNCWGKQEYAGEFKEYKELKTDASQKAFVAKFVETHLDGIRLVKNADTLVCNGCNAKIKK